MKSMATVFRHDGRIYFRTPYHEDFIRRLKAEIPSHCRKWIKPWRVWEISPLYTIDAKLTAKVYFNLATVSGPPVKQEPVIPRYEDLAGTDIDEYDDSLEDENE